MAKLSISEAIAMREGIAAILVTAALVGLVVIVWITRRMLSSIAWGGATSSPQVHAYLDSMFFDLSSAKGLAERWFQIRNSVEPVTAIMDDIIYDSEGFHAGSKIDPQAFSCLLNFWT
jgi:hypothetical protein